MEEEEEGMLVGEKPPATISGGRNSITLLRETVVTVAVVVSTVTFLTETVSIGDRWQRTALWRPRTPGVGSRCPCARWSGERSQERPRRRGVGRATEEAVAEAVVGPRPSAAPRMAVSREMRSRTTLALSVVSAESAGSRDREEEPRPEKREEFEAGKGGKGPGGRR